MKLTRPGKVRFRKGESICMLFPVPAAAVSGVTPEIRHLADDPGLERQAMEWKTHRDAFMARFDAGDAATRKDGWQRNYFLGKRPDGSAPDAQHVNKLRLDMPVDLRGKK